MTRQNKSASIHHEPSLANQLLLASALVIVGICVHLFIYAIHRDDTLSVSNGYVARNETVFKNYNVVYPIFHNEKVDMMMRNDVTHQVDDFSKRVNRKNHDTDNELVINYTIIHYDARTLSIMFHKTERLSGRPTVRSQNVVTYDLQKQTRFQLADIVKDQTTGDALIGRILHDYFQHLKSESFTVSELSQLSSIGLKDIREFALDDDALIIYINPHHPDSQEGRAAISIKKDLLSLVLESTFTAVSPSLAQSTMEQPNYAIDRMPQHDISTDPNVKMLALTFDDGPGNLTPSLLDVLKKYGAHATFFVIGRQVPTYAGTVRREVDEGNEVGNHSWDHANLTRLSYAGLQQQIGSTQQAVKDATGGYTPVLMRPPEGVYNGAVAAYIASQGLRVQLWNVDTLDWLNRDSQVIYNRIMSAAADGRVILLHDIHPTTIAAATRAIPELVAKGYQLVTVSELDKYR